MVYKVDAGLKMLQHKFEIEHNDGRRETKTSTLCECGAPTGSGSYSAMAKLVGVPCGVGKSFLFKEPFRRCDGSQDTEADCIISVPPELEQHLEIHSLSRGLTLISTPYSR